MHKIRANIARGFIWSSASYSGYSDAPDRPGSPGDFCLLQKLPSVLVPRRSRASPHRTQRRRRYPGEFLQITCPLAQPVTNGQARYGILSSCSLVIICGPDEAGTLPVVSLGFLTFVSAALATEIAASDANPQATARIVLRMGFSKAVQIVIAWRLNTKV
jgi:hypothetical protein